MRRVVWVATFAALASSNVVHQKQPSWTWAQVVQGAANNPKTVPHEPFVKKVNPPNYLEYANDNNIHDVEERFPTENDYEYLDDEEFKNYDYVYVDDIEDVENPEEFQLKDDHANRRTLDFLYHTFLQPVLQPDQPAEPSLLGEVFRTIDNHISKDFTSLANLISQGSATVNPVSAQQADQAYGTPVATGIAAGPTGDDLLVTDDLGNQHLVSVDDIVRSLSVLDESSLVDLLLGPAGATDPALSIQLPPGSQIGRAPDLPATQTASAPLNNFQLPAPAPAPLPVTVTPSTASPLIAGVPLPIAQNLPSFFQQNSIGTGEIVILPGQLTKAIRNVAAAQGGEVFRPVRHTGPVNSAASDEEESFLVTDEQGNVQIISMDDILSSLSNLDEETLTSLLVDTSVASTTASNFTLPSKTLINIPVSAHGAIPNSPPAAPLIETDYQHSKLEEPVLSDVQSIKQIIPTTNNKNVVSSDGTQISTDGNGNIYITPDPDKPFTLDIKNIIALAEQAEQGQTKEDKATEFSGALVNQLPGTKTSTTTPTPTPERGNEILAYLAGIDGFLPNPILPGPLRPVEPQQTVQPQVTDLRTALLNALLLQQTTPAPATPGIGAQFSGLLSRIVSQAAQVVGAQPVTPVPQQDEIVQLVVRQQFEDGGEEIYGNINVPLPQSIHHSQLSLQKQQRKQENRNSAFSFGAQRRHDTVPHWKSDLPTNVIEAVLKGMNNIPKFDPSKAVQKEKSPLEKGNLITQHIINTSESRNDNPTAEAVTAEERESHYAVHYQDDQPTYGAPQPEYAAPQPAYAAPQPAYAAPHPAYAAPQPAYAVPQPVYAAPHPVYDPQPVPYGHPVTEKVPLFDLYLLADLNKAKLGDKSNLSKGGSWIGDPSYFVDTRSHHYKHY